ncbi:MAG TPA: SsrA-binding protein [Lentisphaeria bacterium]|nr:MAG: SsrA-binding protein [Lentisphaerae bacterium GWF2_38_69]HBM17586.1 SsrA-binding protein [Lentisphaeria bacterium]
MKDKENTNTTLLQNKKAFHDFEVLERFEAGLELKGTEVKSCKIRNLSFADAFAKVENGEMFLYNVNISPYDHGNIFNHDPKRKRKLLLHKKEILKIFQKARERGLTVVPLSFYLKNGKVKVQIGLAKGKTRGDKRDNLRKKEDNMAIKRAMSR